MYTNWHTVIKTMYTNWHTVTKLEDTVTDAKAYAIILLIILYSLCNNVLKRCLLCSQNI